MKLFKQSAEPACMYCIKSRTSPDTGMCLCSVKGVVPKGYSCRRFYYDPTKRQPPPPPVLPKFSEEEFKL